MCEISCKLPDLTPRPEQRSDHFNEFVYNSCFLKFCENVWLIEQTGKHGQVHGFIFESLSCELPKKDMEY